MKKSRNLLSLFILTICVLLFGCQQEMAIPIPVKGPAVQNFETVQPSWTFQPPETLSLAQSSIITEGMPPKRGNAKVSLPRLSGDYLVYETQHGSLQYVSLDGVNTGTLIEGYLINEMEPGSYTDGLTPIAMLPGGEIPRFVFYMVKTQADQQNLKNASIG